MTKELTKTEQTEAALRVLEAQGFDTKALWREHATRQAASEHGTPTEDDARYELPTECPRTEEHLKGGNAELSPSTLWNGLSYSLSPGMRGLLRDKYGMTPTATVTVAWVEPWPGTRFPRRMLLKSDVHIDPRARKHVLTEVVVDGVGTFFKLAAERDAKAEDDGALRVERALAVGEIAKLSAVERWAVEDLSGVKVLDKVEVTRTSDEKFTVMCLRSGKQATVTRSAFFETVAEYERLYKTKRRSTSGKAAFEVTPALDELIAQLCK